MNYKEKCLFSLLLFLSLILVSVSTGTTEQVLYGQGMQLSSVLYVGGTGPGNYSRIQHALDNASNGDIISVYPGVYYENLVIRNSVTLEGRQMDTTVINGGNSGDIPAIRVDADTVIITGFTIVWADWEYHEPGIKIYSQHVHVHNNNLSFHDKGIILTVSAKECLIENNNFYNNFEGILLFPPGSHNHTIKNNTFEKCSFGIILYSSHKNLIVNNTLKNCSAKAMSLQDSDSNILRENTITKSSRGVYLEGSSKDNLIYNNNFIDNTIQAVNSGSNIWYHGYPDGGNYWDDYKGTDEDKDGFGDEPYQIFGELVEDKQPLLRPSQWEEEELIVALSGPTKGIIQRSYQFSATVSGGLAPYTYTWDFDDGTVSSLKNPFHSYSSPGKYYILLTVRDAINRTKNQSYMMTIYDADNTPPVVSILSPINGLYLQNNLVQASTFLPFCLVFGPITFSIQSSDIGSEISKMTLTIEGIKEQNVTNNTNLVYEWTDEITGTFRVIATAEDIAGNIASEEMEIIRL